MSDTWERTYCPKCQSRNWVSLGDLNDMTVLDVTRVECWKCEHEYPLHDDYEICEYDNDWAEKGRENPDEDRSVVKSKRQGKRKKRRKTQG